MYLKNIILGMILGIGFIIPGVSGGVIATILGIYDNIIYRLNHLFKNFKDNFLYLFPLIIGVIISVFLFSKIILYLLKYKTFFISYVFIGLILGCVPYLFKEIKIKSNKKISIISFLISFLLGILFFIIENNNPTSSDNVNIGIMVIAGVFYAIGKIIPGISGASLLMLLGIYEYFLSILANPLSLNINLVFNLIPFIISFIISSIIILKLIEYCLKKHFRITYSAIIGFVISSVLFIYPNYISALYIFIATLAFTISYNFSK